VSGHATGVAVQQLVFPTAAAAAAGALTPTVALTQALTVTWLLPSFLLLLLLLQAH
jgi:hypothetical protein